MSVYIKGMEMPTGCAFCKLKRRNGKKMVCPLSNEEWDIHDPMSADFRLLNCSLIPVPDHGRLIDADALKASIYCYDTDERKILSTRDLYYALNGWIDSRQTIIPADEPFENSEQLEEAEGGND